MNTRTPPSAGSLSVDGGACKSRCAAFRATTRGLGWSSCREAREPSSLYILLCICESKIWKGLSVATNALKGNITKFPATNPIQIAHILLKILFYELKDAVLCFTFAISCALIGFCFNLDR